MSSYKLKLTDKHKEKIGVTNLPDTLELPEISGKNAYSADKIVNLMQYPKPRTMILNYHILSKVNKVTKYLPVIVLGGAIAVSALTRLLSDEETAKGVDEIVLNNIALWGTIGTGALAYGIHHFHKSLSETLPTYLATQGAIKNPNQPK